MKIYHTLHIGSFHTNYCEDFFVVEKISATKKIIAVLDGCSQGTESVFASILFGKILRKIAKQAYYKDFIERQELPLKELLKGVLKELFSEIQHIKRTLDITTLELLSTLIIGVIDEVNLSTEIMVIGDGLVVVDGESFDFEQGDKPDYFAYHLEENFEDWYRNHKQFITTNFKDLSIATDGIFAFKNLKNPRKQLNSEAIVSFLLKDNEGEKKDYFLDKKIKILQQELDHLPTDDIAIVRVKK